MNIPPPRCRPCIVAGLAVFATLLYGVIHTLVRWLA